MSGSAYIVKPSIPVTVIGGYLGAGKTTLVNHLIRNAAGLRLAILVNDFGELPIDADLIEAEDGGVISLSGGCICCSYGNDLAAALVELKQQQNPPDHLIIEASGVALPRGISGTVSLLRDVHLAGTMVLVDSTSVIKLSRDKYLADTIIRQLEDAHCLLLNKFDLLSTLQKANISAWIHEKFPQLRWVETVFAVAPVSLVLGLRDCQPNAQVLNASAADALVTETQLPDAQLKDQHGADVHLADAQFADDSATPSRVDHDATVFHSIEIRQLGPVESKAIAARLAEPGAGILRAKGFVVDVSGRMKTIQVVGHHWQVSDAPDHVQSGLVCIGKKGEFCRASLQRWCGLSPIK